MDFPLRYCVQDRNYYVLLPGTVKYYGSHDAPDMSVALAWNGRYGVIVPIHPKNLRKLVKCDTPCVNKTLRGGRSIV